MKRRKEQFKARVRQRKSRIALLYRFGLAYVVLGFGLICIGAIRI